MRTRPQLHEEQCVVYGWERGFEQVAERWRPWIEERAQRFTTRRGLLEDLIQEAMILLWELDPARVDASDQAAVRQLLAQRMRRLVNEDFRARGGGRSAPRSARSVESLPIAFTELANEL